MFSVVSAQNRCPSSPAISQSQDKKHDEEFSSLTLDIDNSIHQLNQLILDLDPTFVPISTKPSCFSGAGGADTQTRQTGEITHPILTLSCAGVIILTPGNSLNSLNHGHSVIIYSSTFCSNPYDCKRKIWLTTRQMK